MTSYTECLKDLERICSMNDDSTRNRLKCFNISRSIDSDNELNIDENNTNLDNEWKNVINQHIISQKIQFT
ncbi:piggyBac transposable element-derived protein 4-like [Vespula maculifrons]|uniref:PiggyBac transposable element-derived protein 4-like n=1 Tax=Vespula maculifrons TaxID=7453 RepID=A0ABD2BHL1_VESMC